MTSVRRAAAVGSAALGALVALYAHGDERSPRPSDTGPTLDPDVVAVHPFSVRGSRPGLSDLGDVMQDLVAARMPGGDGGPRAIIVRRAPRRAVSSVTPDVQLDEALRMTAGLGAAQLLRGMVSGTTERLSIEAEVLGVAGGTVRARARIEGSVDSLAQLAHRLTARLLAIQVARDSDEMAALTGTSSAALRAYLSGLHATRQGRVGTSSEATTHFERALFLDSTFAIAGLRLAELAAVFGMTELDERWKLDVIWNQRRRLSPADQALLVAYLGPHYPRPGTRAELIAAAERAADAMPHRAEAWRIAGVHVMRFGAMIGHPAWEARAEEALSRALALDSTDAIALEFLLRLEVNAGDRVAAERYVGLELARSRTTARSDFYRWLAATLRGDSLGLAAMRRRLAAMPRLSLRYIVEWSQALGAGLEDADRAARVFAEGARSAGERRTVTVGISPFLLNRGRPAAANRLLDTAERGFGQRADVGVLEFRLYAALFWDGDAGDATAAAQTLAAYVDGAVAEPGQVRAYETAACALAHWRLAVNDLPGADGALARIRRLGTTPGWRPIESTPVCVAAVEAQLAAARHRSDAVATLERLDALLRAGSDVRHLLPSVATLIAARLYERRGDLVSALAMVRRRASWSNQLLSTQLREEGRLAALVGDTVGAVRAYRHYLALRSDPEPRLRPEVERVQAEVERLERLSPVP